MATIGQIRAERRAALRKVLILLDKTEALANKAERNLRRLVANTKKIAGAKELASIANDLASVDKALDATVGELARAGTVVGTI